jgi:arsenite-transporting ATPase
MSLVESQRFVTALEDLGIPWGGVLLNRVQFTPHSEPNSGTAPSAVEYDRLLEQRDLVKAFETWVDQQPLWLIPQNDREPVGLAALGQIFEQITPIGAATFPALSSPSTPLTLVTPQPPFLPDFLAQGRKLIILGGKGGVGKTTVSAAIGWGLSERYPQSQIRIISIDPAHSLGDAFGCGLGHTPTPYSPSLSLQEVDADRVLDQFREDYLWELAEMMSGDREVDPRSNQGIQILYGPEAWRTLAAQSLPGIDEMLSLIAVMDLLDRGEQDLIVLDTAPTGHLLRFLEMPTALGDWLGWIFKLWIKYKDVVGRADLMGRLRGLRQQVVEAQKKLTDPNHSEFIAVCQNQSAIVAETQRLMQELEHRGISHHYVINNRADLTRPIAALQQTFTQQALIHLPALPRSISPSDRIAQAAQHLLGDRR